MPIHHRPTLPTALAALACIALASCGGGPGGGQPDLVVVAPEVSDTRPDAKASLTFSATVRNAGARSAAAATLRVFRSDDATITRSDEQVGAGTVAALAASASRVVSVELRAPSSPGTYYYGACVDAVAREADTANNCSAAIEVTVRDPAPVPPLPDLVVESPAVSPDTAPAGADFTFSATVRNAGERSAAATTLRVFRSDDATITASDEQVGAGTVAALAASASRPVSLKVTGASPEKTYYYGACVDAVAGESDTANNCSAAVQVTVQAPPVGAPASIGPDLTIVGPWVDSTIPPAIGGLSGLSAKVLNRGRTTDAVTTLRFYRSTDATITRSDTQLAAQEEWLGPESSIQEFYVYVYVKAPSSKGVYYYGACVDAVAGESATTNNCSAAVKVDVSHNRPDLWITPLNVLGSYPVGESFSLGMTVNNTGSPSDATTLRLLLLPSRTSAPSAGTQVVEVSVPELVVTQAEPASSTQYVEFQAPATPGWYYYYMCVDAVPRETDTTNNCSDTKIWFR